MDKGVFLGQRCCWSIWGFSQRYFNKGSSRRKLQNPDVLRGHLRSLSLPTPKNTPVSVTLNTRGGVSFSLLTNKILRTPPCGVSGNLHSPELPWIRPGRTLRNATNDWSVRMTSPQVYLPMTSHCRRPVGAVLLTVGRSYVGNDVTHATLLDRAGTCSYENLPKYRSYRVSNTAPCISPPNSVIRI